MQDAIYYGAERNNRDAEKRAARLLMHWRKNNWPIYHVKHNSEHQSSPLFPGKETNAFHDLVAPENGETRV